MGKLTKKEKIEIIYSWLNDFPCQTIFGKYVCIHEFLTPKELYNFIQQKHKEYKRG